MPTAQVLAIFFPIIASRWPGVAFIQKALHIAFAHNRRSSVILLEMGDLPKMAAPGSLRLRS
jgi:hypothetical protein